MQIKCKCGYEWNYKGKKKVNATCPDCRAIARIPSETTETTEIISHAED